MNQILALREKRAKLWNDTIILFSFRLCAQGA